MSISHNPYHRGERTGFAPDRSVRLYPHGILDGALGTSSLHSGASEASFAAADGRRLADCPKTRDSCHRFVQATVAVDGGAVALVVPYDA